jgi:hypothetical protein
MMLVTMEEYDKKERDAEASVKQRYKDVARSVVTHAWLCRHNAMHAETGVSKGIEHGSLETWGWQISCQLHGTKRNSLLRWDI